MFEFLGAMSYRKKPIVVKAIQWDGSVELATSIIDWILKNGSTASYNDSIPEHSILSIQTTEGTMAARAGWWIIQGTRGEFYPCREDAFADTFEISKLEMYLPCFLPGNNRDWDQLEGYARLTITDRGQIIIDLKKEDAERLVKQAETGLLYQASFDYRMDEETLRKINSQNQKKDL